MKCVAYIFSSLSLQTFEFRGQVQLKNGAFWSSLMATSIGSRVSCDKLIWGRTLKMLEVDV